MTDGKPQFSAGGIPIIVIQVLLPVLLAIVAGYGAVKYSSGETQQRLQELQRVTQTNREEIERVRNNAVTREEMRLFIESARQDLQEIKADIRAIRYGENRR